MTTECIEPWRWVARTGVFPAMTDAELLALRDGLLADDSRLIQGDSIRPVALHRNYGRRCEGGCLIAYPGMATGRRATVARVEERFSDIFHTAAAVLGDESSVRELAWWWDSTPRAEAVPLALEEVELALAGRKGVML